MLRFCTFKLRLHSLDPEFRTNNGSFGPLCIGLLGLKIGSRLLRALHSAGSFFHQFLCSRCLLLRKLKLRLSLFELRLRLIYLRTLGIDLRLIIGNVGLGDRDLRVSLLNGDLVIAVINPRQQIARVDMLIVRYGNIDHIAADFRCQGETSGCYKRIIRRFVMAVF